MRPEDFRNKLLGNQQSTPPLEVANTRKSAFKKNAEKALEITGNLGVTAGYLGAVAIGKSLLERVEVAGVLGGIAFGGLFGGGVSLGRGLFEKSKLGDAQFIQKKHREAREKGKFLKSQKNIATRLIVQGLDIVSLEFVNRFALGVARARNNVKIRQLLGETKIPIKDYFFENNNALNDKLKKRSLDKQMRGLTRHKELLVALTVANRFGSNDNELSSLLSRNQKHLVDHFCEKEDENSQSVRELIAQKVETEIKKQAIGVIFTQAAVSFMRSAACAGILSTTYDAIQSPEIQEVIRPKLELMGKWMSETAQSIGTYWHNDPVMKSMQKFTVDNITPLIFGLVGGIYGSSKTREVVNKRDDNTNKNFLKAVKQEVAVLAGGAFAAGLSVVLGHKMPTLINSYELNPGSIAAGLGTGLLLGRGKGNLGKGIVSGGIAALGGSMMPYYMVPEVVLASITAVYADETRGKHQRMKIDRFFTGLIAGVAGALIANQWFPDSAMNQLEISMKLGLPNTPIDFGNIPAVLEQIFNNNR